SKYLTNGQAPRPHDLNLPPPRRCLLFKESQRPDPAATCRRRVLGGRSGGPKLLFLYAAGAGGGGEDDRGAPPPPEGVGSGEGDGFADRGALQVVDMEEEVRHGEDREGRRRGDDEVRFRLDERDEQQQGNAECRAAEVAGVVLTKRRGQVHGWEV